MLLKLEMKIIDCFTFLNEFELLDLRLSLLNKTVDYFIISEANVTFTGKQKEYNFEKKLKKFSKYLDKIIYIKHKPKIDHLDFSIKHNFYTEKSPQREVERSQRNSFVDYLKNFNKNDLFLVSDLDEIWDPRLGTEFRNYSDLEFLCRLEMKFHYFYFNCQGIGKNNKSWHKAFFCKVSKLDNFNDLHYIRNNLSIPIIKDGGWHFSYLADAQAITKKISSFAHTAFDTPYFNNKEKIQNSIDNAIDPFDREDHKWQFKNISEYPKFLQNEFKKYPRFIRDI